MTNDEQTAADLQAAVETMHTTARGSGEWGNARAFLCRLLEDDLKEWIKEHPPTVLGLTSYAADDPDRAVGLYGDNLAPGTARDTLRDILYESQTLFMRVAKRAIQSLRSKSLKSTRDAVTARYPEYPALLKEIRETKRTWNAEDAEIRRGESFRMMGGLARLGSRAGGQYRHLVERAQTMEKAVLGRILTSYTRVSS